MLEEWILAGVAFDKVAKSKAKTHLYSVKFKNQLTMELEKKPPMG